MRRYLILACMVFGTSAMFATGVSAQQANVTGPELLSGNADRRLQDVARSAKDGGKKLVISAPEYWHEMILEQVRKGGGGDVQVELRDSFAETVSVRAEDTAPAPAPEPTPEPEPTPVAAPAPKPTPPPVQRTIPSQAPAQAATPPAPRNVPTPAPATPTVAAPAPKPAPVPPARPAPTPAQTPPVVPQAAAPAPPPAPAPAPVPEPEPATAAVVPAAPAPTPAAPPPTAVATPAPPAAPARAASSDAEIASIKRRLEQNLNGGKTVGESLTQTALEVGDVIYVQGPVRAVLRRGSVRNELYWLEGELNLMRVELKELAGERYQVAQRIRVEGTPRLREVRTTQSEMFTAASPEGSAERAQLERRYNGGSAITGQLRPENLQQKDVLYLGDKLVVVVRLDGMNLERYWLVGDINLGRTELLKDGANKYKVLADIR